MRGTRAKGVYVDALPDVILIARLDPSRRFAFTWMRSVDLTLRIPDDLATRLVAAGDLPRRALEALAIEEYRVGRLGRADLRRLLGFNARTEVDAFLKGRGVDDSMTRAEFERDRADLDRLGV